MKNSYTIEMPIETIAEDKKELIKIFESVEKGSDIISENEFHVISKYIEFKNTSVPMPGTLAYIDVKEQIVFFSAYDFKSDSKVYRIAIRVIDNMKENFLNEIYNVICGIEKEEINKAIEEKTEENKKRRL